LLDDVHYRCAGGDSWCSPLSCSRPPAASRAVPPRRLPLPENGTRSRAHGLQQARTGSFGGGRGSPARSECRRRSAAWARSAAGCRARSDRAPYHPRLRTNWQLTSNGRGPAKAMGTVMPVINQTFFVTVRRTPGLRSYSAKSWRWPRLKVSRKFVPRYGVMSQRHACTVRPCLMNLEWYVRD